MTILVSFFLGRRFEAVCETACAGPSKTMKAIWSCANLRTGGLSQKSPAGCETAWADMRSIFAYCCNSEEA